MVENGGGVDEKRGFLTRLRERLARFRGSFVRQLDQLLSGKKKIDSELLDELEEVMVMSDMGMSTVQKIFERISVEVDREQLDDPSALRTRLKDMILEILASPVNSDHNICANGIDCPCVVLVVGVNGVGKTTTIAKLAHLLLAEGRRPLLIAADTFRAAAVEQLVMWGERLGVPVISGSAGADPSAVVFDGLDAALSRKSDIVLIDTAGRLHTEVNLMGELKKVIKVIGRKVAGAPHETLLVLDATTGQNALNQARLFAETTNVTGVVMTKLDGTARGGIVVGIIGELGIPVRYVGVGESLDDLMPFVSSDFAEALFEG